MECIRVLCTGFFFGGGTTLYFAHPTRRNGSAAKVEGIGVEQRLELHVGIIGLDNGGIGLNNLQNCLDARQFFGAHFRHLVEQNHIAELDLLDDEVLDILLADVLLGEAITAGKLALQTQSIDHCHDAVETRHPETGDTRVHATDGADGLCNRLRLAYSTGLNYYIVELLHSGDIVDLLHEVHLQSTAYAAILQGHEAVVLLSYHTTLLNKGGIDVDFANVVDNYGKLDAFFVSEDMVDECSLSTAEITGQEQYRNLFVFHFKKINFLELQKYAFFCFNKYRATEKLPLRATIMQRQ